MRTHTRRVVAVVVSLIVVLPAAALADGKLFSRSGDLSAFASLEQNAQQAAICFGDGRERMVIAISYNAVPGDEGLWIFPVPGTPDQVDIDLCDAFPRFWGHDSRHWARSIVDRAMLLMRASQIYPLIADLALRHARFRKHGNENEKEAAEVYETIERWGLRAETLTAPSTAALASHLGESGAEIPPDELSPFEPYLNGAYVLVVVRVTDRAALETQFGESDDDTYDWQSCWPTLYVEFPTDNGFYPMRPTASYGDTQLPVTLYIIGHVEAHADPEMLDEANVYHYRQDRPDWPAQSLFGLSRDTTFDYTVVYLDTPASVFTSDFAFTPTQVRGHAFAEVITDLRWRLLVIGLAVFAVLSYLSAGVAGIVSGQRWRRAAPIGLLNFLSLFGVVVGAVFVLKHPRLGRFIAVFTVLFVGATVLLHVLLASHLGV